MNIYECKGVSIEYDKAVERDDKYILADNIITNLINAGNDILNFKLKMYETYTEITPSNRYWHNNKNKAKLLILNGSYKQKGFTCIIKFRLQYLNNNWDGDRTGLIIEIRTNYIDVEKSY